MSDQLQLDDAGWLVCTRPWIRHSPSPNFDERPPEGAEICLIVVHAISVPPEQFSGDAVEQFFLNQLDPTAHPYFAAIAGLRVSAHFMIRRTGEVIQFVSTRHRAWHAGASSWRGRERCNDFSVGIELEGSDSIGFEALQYERLNMLNSALATHMRIQAIVGHSDIAPGRKTDPGPCFDWSRIRPTSA